jgi:hypothetical protein
MELCGHESSGGAVRAHEFGHEVGLYDEYREGAIYVPTDASGAVTGQPPTPEVEGSIMQNGTSVNRNHLDEFHAWFLSVANDAYEPERL